MACVDPSDEAAIDGIEEENTNMAEICSKNGDSNNNEKVLMTFINTAHPQEMLTQQHKMQKLGLLTDVCLESGDKAVSCHKVVLVAASPYFWNLFATGPDESGIIHLQEVDSSVLEILVEYMYTTTCSITEANVQHLTRACTFLGLEQLKAACEKVLIQQTASNNCITMMRFGRKQGLPSLESRGNDVMLSSFSEVVDGPDFLTLSPDELASYISDDGLVVEKEDVTYLAVMKWLEANDGHPDDIIENIVKQIRLPFCTPSFLSKTVRKNKLFRKDPFLEYLQEARDYQIFGEDGADITKSSIQIRSCFPKEITVTVEEKLTAENKKQEAAINDLRVERNKLQFENSDLQIKIDTLEEEKQQLEEKFRYNRFSYHQKY